MRDLLSDYDRLATLGRPVGRAVVTSVWGSAPRPEGSSMLATADGTMAGSVSGGCVEGATATEIGEAIGRGTPKLVTFGVTHERAWEVGLACGGTIKVFVEPRVRPEVLAAARGPGGEVVATVIDGPGTGGSAPDLRGRPHGRHASARGSRRGGPRRRARTRSAARPAPPPPIDAGADRRASSSRCSHASRGWSSSAASTSPSRWCHWRARSAIARSWPTAGRLSSRRERFPGRRPAASSRGRRRPSSRSGSTRRATSASCRTTPSSTSPRSSSRSARRRATSARSARARRRRPGATRLADDGIHRRGDRPGARTDRAGPGRPPARRDGAGDSGGDDGGALRRGRGGES